MAGCDYATCDVCGGKTFYDAEVDYSFFNGIQKVLCDECSKTHEIIIKKKDNTAVHSDGADAAICPDCGNKLKYHIKGQRCGLI